MDEVLGLTLAFIGVPAYFYFSLYGEFLGVPPCPDIVRGLLEE